MNFPQTRKFYVAVLIHLIKLLLGIDTELSRAFRSRIDIREVEFGSSIRHLRCYRYHQAVFRLYGVRMRHRRENTAFATFQVLKISQILLHCPT